MRVTQKDIARALNISQSLVAGVLGDKPGVWASPENRERIQRAAREMGYRPNTAARRLRSGKSDSVGFVVLNPTSDAEPRRLTPEYGGIVATLTQFLGPQGYDLVLKTFADPEEALDGLTELAQTRACDAFVLRGPSAQIERQAARLEELRAPFVVMGSLEASHPNWPQIDFDHARMMHLSVTHLAGLGHRRIAYIGHDNMEQYAIRLEKGFLAAMREVLDQPIPDKHLARFGAGRERYVEAQITRWLSDPPGSQPKSVVLGASDDATWRGLELGLAHTGLRLGEGAGEFPAIGLHHTEAPLLFGQAQGFAQTDLAHLTETLCASLLAPLLRGETPTECVLRVCPEMRPMQRLGLLNYVRFRENQVKIT